MEDFIKNLQLGEEQKLLLMTCELRETEQRDGTLGC